MHFGSESIGEESIRGLEGENVFNDSLNSYGM